MGLWEVEERSTERSEVRVVIYVKKAIASERFLYLYAVQ